MQNFGLGFTYLPVDDEFSSFPQEAASMDLNTDYEDFVNIKGIQVGPLNYAPSDKYSSVNENLVPVSQLKHLPSPSKDDSKCNLLKIQFEKQF